MGSPAAADEPALFPLGTFAISSFFFLPRVKVNFPFAEVSCVR